MKNSLAKKLLLALLLLSTMPTAFCERGKLESFHMQIVGKYFENFKDYQNLEMVNKNFETYVAIPGENQTRNKLSEKIKHLVFLENSFDFGRFNKVMEENEINPSAVKIIKPEDKFSMSWNWEMKIVALPENHGCKIIFSRENKDKTETITFYLDVFVMSRHSKNEFNLSETMAVYNNLINSISNRFGRNLLPEINKNRITTVTIPEKVEFIYPFLISSL